jgi:putative ABC transport system permease protein
MATEPFAYRRGIQEGDALELPIEGGTREFRVAGIYPDFSSDLGFVIMDWSEFRRLFPSETSANAIALELRAGVDLEAARSAIYQALSGEDWPKLTIATTGEIRRNGLEVFDRTFAVTRALLLIAIAVAVLGVSNALMAMIADRREELLTLRCLGVSRGRLARVVMLESALLGAAGTVLGTACGMALSLLLLRVVNKQSFGWTIPFSPPAGALAFSILALYSTTLLAGLLPARQAARADWRRR